MKDLSIEEKAKAYDSIFERLKKMYNNNKTNIVHRLIYERYFPELVESEDEKIRKTLKSFFDSEISDYGNVEWRNGIRYGEIVAWLEKQGEQKPTDKVEPKFKVGDWVVSEHSGNTYQIHSIDYSNSNYIRYMCEPLFDNNNDILCFSEEMIHLWTIQDAKSGDVLANYNSIIIFRKIGNKTWNNVIDYYISYSYNYGIIVQKDKSHYGNINETTFKPAIEEKRNLLFQKMKEADYEWNADKKVLKKIEQKFICGKEDSVKLNDVVKIVENSGNVESITEYYTK